MSKEPRAHVGAWTLQLAGTAGLARPLGGALSDVALPCLGGGACRACQSAVSSLGLAPYPAKLAVPSAAEGGYCTVTEWLLLQQLSFAIWLP